MPDIIEQLKDAVADMTEEEIADQLSQSAKVPPDKVAVLSAWLASLNA